MQLVLALQPPASGQSLEAEYEDLATWLREEPVLRSAVALDREPPADGEMSAGLIAALVVAVGGHGAITVLAGALKSWLRQKGKRDLHIRVEESQSKKVVVVDARGHSAADLEGLVSQLSEAIADDAP